MRLLAIGLLLLSSLASAKGPSKADAAKTLKAALSGKRLRVSNVLADLGDGRVPVLFVIESKDCYKVGADPENQEQQCDEVQAPRLAVLSATGVDGIVELAAGGANFQWGINTVKDFDGDGKPELALTFAWEGHNSAGIGAPPVKHLAIANLDKPPAIAFTTQLEDSGYYGDQFTTKWKFAGTDLVLTRRVGERGSFEEKAETKVETWKWDRGSDSWKR